MIMIFLGKCKIKSVLCLCTLQELKGNGPQNFPLRHVHLQQRGNKQTKTLKNVKEEQKSLKRTSKEIIMNKFYK